LAAQTIASTEPASLTASDTEMAIVVENVDVGYGDFMIQRNLNFAVRRGEIFVIMGGSGCGKTTVMRAMVGLKEPARGKTVTDGVSFWEADPPVRERLARSFGIVYQSGALWSSMTLAENVALPLGEYTDLGRSDIQDVVALKLALVGLAGFEDYYPSEISGGMRKRAGVARALALDPEILVADEAVSALDVSVQAQVLDLLEDLKARLGLSMLFITHDLRVAAQICDRIAVMQHGAIVELKSASLLFAAPEHAYTRELLSAVPGQTSSSKAA
jgi:phospholipid/cholesterol/gamma-HCH transport system ATP-binding protein